MFTDRFNKLRRDQLNSLFDKKQIAKIWRNIVKSQLRNLDIKDLYDYYDFNYNIEIQSQAIRTDILSGNYQVSKPLIYRIEKKLGICRHIVVPQPSDSLILQVITENISDEILNHQPSKNTFYSRDKHNVGKPHDVVESGFHWRELWRRLQKTIYKFNSDKELLIVTDLSNYFDSIDMDALRKSILSYSDKKEAQIDLLFKIVEEISWRPDYLPYMQRGLPTSNLEGIRLLSHLFLFELDNILEQRSQKSFARWMDDIIIAVDTRDDAINILSSASDVLKSKGLALNLAKTQVFNADEGRYHFQIEANRYLDTLEYDFKPGKKYNAYTSELKKNFKKHLKDTRPKYWDKVAKRYITAFGRLKSEKLLTEVSTLYNEFPGLRKNLLVYLQKLGYKKRTGDIVIKIIENLNVHDDISLFEVCHLVTKWEIPVKDSSEEFLKNFESKITKISARRKNSFDFFCLLWFKAKYNHPDELDRFIRRYDYIWKLSPFLKRQVTAITSRLLLFNKDNTIEFLRSLISTGDLQTISLATQVLDFRKVKSLNNKLNFYLFPPNGQRPYPLSKFIVLCNLLTSEEFRTNEKIVELIKKSIHDPYYLKWIEAFYNIK